MIGTNISFLVWNLTSTDKIPRLRSCFVVPDQAITHYHDRDCDRDRDSDLARDLDSCSTSSQSIFEFLGWCRQTKAENGGKIKIKTKQKKGKTNRGTMNKTKKERKILLTIIFIKQMNKRQHSHSTHKDTTNKAFGLKKEATESLPLFDTDPQTDSLGK